jgi:uridine phosphorylase
VARRVNIKNRVFGGLGNAYRGTLTRAERIARAEFGCTSVAPTVIMPATGEMTRRLVARLKRARRCGATWRGRFGGREVSVVNTGLGAPSAAGKAFACLGLGATTLLRADVCGGLDPAARVGDVVVAEAAVPLDGATLALAGPEELPASPLLLATARRAAGTGHCRFPITFAKVVTVDIFHHQTDELHRRWRERARVVDMETSIIYHLARDARADALSCLAVSDVRLGGRDPFADGPFPLDAYGQGLDDVITLVAAVTASLPDGRRQKRDSS